MKIKKKEGIKDIGISICFLSLAISILIYPLLLSATTWKIIEVLCLGIICTFVLKKGRISMPKLWVCWAVTIIPLVYHSMAIKFHEYGFTLLWMTFLLLILESTDNSKWIKYVLLAFGLLPCIYAISTILFNFNIDMGLSKIASLFRESVVTGTLATAGFTSHYSHNGMYIAIGCVLWYAKALSSKKPRHFLMLFMFLIALLFTQKRGPLIALAVAMVVTYYFIQRGDMSTRLNRMLFILFAVLFSVYLLYIFMPSAFTVFERFTGDDGTLTNRQYLWEHAINCFKRRPLTGLGWGAYSHSLWLRIDTVRVRDMDAHNIYLQLLAETGIIGFTLFMTAFAITFSRSIKIVKRVSGNRLPIYFAICMQAFFLVYGLSGNPLYDKQMVMPYMTAVAIVLNYNQKMLKQQRGEVE